MATEKEQALKEAASRALTVVAKTTAIQINDEIIPAIMDVVTEKIPGQVDNSIAEMIKPIIKTELDKYIEQIQIKL